MTEIEHVLPRVETDRPARAARMDISLELGPETEAYLSSLTTALNIDRSTLVATIVKEWLTADKVLAK